MILPDFEAWAIFSAVAEAGSFSRAAVTLGLSKATVSKALARLEARLGTPLLHRTSRRLSLTGSGHAALERAGRLLADGEALEREAGEHGAAPRGAVRMAAPISFGVQALAPLLPEFLERYPEVTVDLRLSDHRVDLVAGGFDVALRIGVLGDSALRARRISAMRRPLVAAPSYLARHGHPAHPRDLSRHRAILFTQTEAPATWTFHHPTQGDCSVTVAGRLKLDNAEAALPTLLAGAGVALMPDFLVWREAQSGALQELLRDWQMPEAGLYLVTPPGRERASAVAALIRFVGGRLRAACWARAAPPELAQGAA